MTERWWNDAELDPTHQAAAEWFARLQRADIAPEDWLAWQRWLAANPRNAEAFARLEEVCGMLRDVPRPPTSTEHSRMGPASRPQYDGTEAISRWRSRAVSRRWLALAASVTAAAVLLGGGYSLWNTRPGEFQTSVGENRTVQLSDGSHVILGGNTLLRATFSDTARHIELARGEALFSVTKDRTRPFSVRAGKATVVAVGTQFNVRRREDRVDVAVVEGEVVIEPAAATAVRHSEEHAAPAGRHGYAAQHPDRRTVRMTAGEKTIISTAGIQPVSRFSQANAPVAWRLGRLVFEREPLRGVVEDVNRYSKKPLFIEDKTIGDLMFTGTVLNGNVDGWIASIEEVFSLEAVEERDRIVLRSGSSVR